MVPQETSGMGILSFIEKLFELVAPPKAKKLDGTTEAALARSLSALLPEERGWITGSSVREEVWSQRLSSGEQQRVALARALLMRNRVQAASMAGTSRTITMYAARNQIGM